MIYPVISGWCLVGTGSRLQKCYRVLNIIKPLNISVRLVLPFSMHLATNPGAGVSIDFIVFLQSSLFAESLRHRMLQHSDLQFGSYTLGVNACCATSVQVLKTGTCKTLLIKTSC